MFILSCSNQSPTQTRITEQMELCSLKNATLATLSLKIKSRSSSWVMKRAVFFLAVQGASGDQVAQARHFPKQGADGWDLVALGLDRFLSHGQA